MQISSRFTVALHIFACTEYFKDKCKVTSDFLASSINTNPVIIRSCHHPQNTFSALKSRAYKSAERNRRY